MKRAVLAGLATLTCLTVGADRSRACTEYPVAYISDWNKFVKLGEWIEFDAFDCYDPDNGPPYSQGHGIVPYTAWTPPPEAQGWSEYHEGGWGSHRSRAYCYFDTPGRYYVYVEVTDDEGWTDSDYSVVRAIKVHLNGGGCVGLNDLAEIELAIDPGNPQLNTGRATLEAVSGGDKIRVWCEQTKETEMTLPKTWLLYRGDVNSSLWVEGIDTSSSSNDVELKLSFDYWGPAVDSNTIEFTVINLQITQPDGEPAWDNEFAFNDQAIGVCTVNATGTSGVTGCDSNLVWLLEDITDPATQKDPEQDDGPDAEFTYTGLPSSNSEFGEKMLSLTYAGGCGSEDTQNVEIFFAKWGYNHSGPGSGDTPNWYYYWKEGGVVADMFNFEYEDADRCGVYYPDTDTLCVCNRAPEDWGDAIQGTFYNHRYQTSINTGEDGWASSNNDWRDAKVLPFWDDGHNSWVWCEPYSVAITAGPNGNIDTLAQGNDGIESRPGEGWILHTGWDGRLSWDTVLAGDDQWKIYTYMGREKHIDPGWGRPWTSAIVCGNDDWMISLPVGDDEIDLTGAHTVTWSVPAVTGIDSCAITCKHELNHQQIMQMVRINQNPPYQYDATADNDYVDDDYEVSSDYHLCPEHIDTYDFRNALSDLLGGQFPGGWIPDLEFLAYMDEQTPGQTNASKDWSDTDGKNWQE